MRQLQDVPPGPAPRPNDCTIAIANYLQSRPERVHNARVICIIVLVC